jgi:copper chaperone CopZ
VSPITLSVVTSDDEVQIVDSPGSNATERVEFRVEGMHCGSCVALVQESLEEQVGVGSATVDLDAARAVVTFDPSAIDVDALAAVVAEAGYVATPAG